MSTQANGGMSVLPPRFDAWFAGRGWQPRPHQLDLLKCAQSGQSALLIAPTGGGKTLAGFLPSLIDLSERNPAERPRRAIHTLYISPLKALAVDIARNLDMPIKEMDLPISVETRTGDTPASRRQRQRYQPPDILLTTPEQIALLLSHPSAVELFSSLKAIVLDELHALVTSKRGDLLSLGLARLTTLAPQAVRIGLSATVAESDDLRRYLAPQSVGKPVMSELIVGAAGAKPEVTVLASAEHIPWAGHMARHALPEVMNAIRANQMVLLFVNTRRQAEIVFQDLWTINEETLPIALHHGSLAVEQRRKVEAAMADGKLRAIVCTSTLDLGIDWGDVDLVIHIGAPKGASRLVQRIGRSNHRLDEPSRALLVPANRFEVLECEAAREAAEAGDLDGETNRRGGLDVLAQHILGMACCKPFDPVELYDEICSAAPYDDLAWEEFEKLLDFIATGGYALRAYDRYRRIVQTPEGTYRVAHPKVIERYRMNVGTIVEEPMIKVRLVRAGSQKKMAGRPSVPRGGRVLGEMEEYFIDQLRPGDTFVFGGEVLRFEAMRETECLASRTQDESAMVPAYAGGKFPLSTFLAERVRKLIANPDEWGRLPAPVSEWLGIQKWRSRLPDPEGLLVETFPRNGKFYLVCYPFDGRLAHQTLGMLLTRRLERMGARPMGFVATEYSLAVWGLRDMTDLDMSALFDEDMLGDDLDAWLRESSLMKRTFRNCAIIAGLIERRFPGQEKSGRQVTISSDLIYNVLEEHEPDHVLLQATWRDAATGMLDIGRLGELLRRIKGHIVVEALDRVSPLAVPVMLQIGKEPVYGEASEDLLRDAEDALIEEATRLV